MNRKTIITAALLCAMLCVPLALFGQDFEMNGTVLVKYNGSAANVTIPAGVTAIGNEAFAGCASLTSVTIPSSVTTIDYGAFAECDSLAGITLPFVGNTLNGTKNTNFGYIFGAVTGYYNEDYVPLSLRTVVITGGSSIGSSAFYGCTGIASITIPAGVTAIGNEAFARNRSLTSVTIPASVMSIGEGAFMSCTGLTSVTFEGNAITSANFGGAAFPQGMDDGFFVSGDSLKTSYLAGGAGTYTRVANSGAGFDVWTKQ